MKRLATMLIIAIALFAVLTAPARAGEMENPAPEPPSIIQQLINLFT